MYPANTFKCVVNICTSQADYVLFRDLNGNHKLAQSLPDLTKRALWRGRAWCKEHVPESVRPMMEG